MKGFDLTNVKQPTVAQYERALRELLATCAPNTYACMKCGWPVIRGYCCQICGDNNPSKPKDSLS